MAQLSEIVGKENIQQFIELDKLITRVDENLRALNETIKANNGQLNKSEQSYKELTTAKKTTVRVTEDLTEEEKQLEKIDKRLKASTDKLVRAKLEATKASKEQKERIQDELIQQDKQVGTLTRLTAENKRLIRERNKLNLETKEGQNRLREINTQLDKNNAAIKKNSSALEKQKINIGNYKSALGGLRLAYVAVAAAIVGVIRQIGKLVEKADIQLKAEAKLLTALKGREDVQKRLMAQASQLQGITLFGDEETINAQAYLAAMGLNESAIKRLIPLVQDLATKNGTDLKTAADLVAKSVGSSTNALSRYGIQIEGEVGSVNRLESAIDGLNAQVGGQAEAAAKAGAGAATQFSNAWGDVQEQLGTKLLPTLTKLFNKMTNSLKSAKQIREEVYQSSLARQELLDVSQFKQYVNTLRERGVEEKNLLKLSERFLRVDRERLEVETDPRQVQIYEDRIRAVEEYATIATEGLNFVYKSEEEMSRESLRVIEDIARQKAITKVQVEQEITKTTLDNIQQRTDAEIESVDIIIAEQERLRAQRLEDAEEGLIAASYYANEIEKINNQFFEGQSIKLKNQKEYELQLAGDNQDKIAAINEKYAQKEAELRKKQAIQNKAFAVFQATIDFARALIAALTVPPPASIVLYAITAALAGAQLAAVLATPVPEFYKGTESAPGGLISVGERGRELIQTREGKVLMANEPMITAGLRGARIFSNPETEAILRYQKSGHDSNDLRLALEKNNKDLIKAIRNKREIRIERGQRVIGDRQGDYFKNYISRKIIR